ncbi:MAG: TetR family transcriptional regulator [Gammaproteobacteria bacterium]|nr:TetR family transcriptional regulator [Gammaproteobacteria bacterium]
MSQLNKDTLLDSALGLASNKGWEAFTMSQLAERLDVSLTEIYQLVKQKDDLAEALFDRADLNMLATSHQDDFQQASPQQKLQQLMSSWLNTLTPYRPMVRQMFGYKLEPGHLHLQALGLLRISRTVQWMLHASDTTLTGLHRIKEEIILTQLYLAAVTYWIVRGPNEQALQKFLNRLLARYIT